MSEGKQTLCCWMFQKPLIKLDTSLDSPQVWNQRNRKSSFKVFFKNEKLGSGVLCRYTKGDEDFVYFYKQWVFIRGEFCLVEIL